MSSERISQGGEGIAARIVSALSRVIRKPPPVGLHEPIFEGKEAEYLNDCLRSGYVSSIGAFVSRFETELAAVNGMKAAVAVVNGTAALELALDVCGVGPDDEVLMPALTFVATANAVRHLGAWPHFIDTCGRTLGIDAAKLEAHLSRIARCDGDGRTVNRETGRRLAAIVPVHIFGHVGDLKSLSAVAADYGLVMIDDAAESLGSRYRDGFSGHWCRMSVLSFNGNKIVTTGGGGAVLTDDPALAGAARHLSTTAKVPHPWQYVHDRVGYNYRMPNLNAALGCAQLERLEHFVAAKRDLAGRYHEAFAGMEGVRTFMETQDCRSNYWLNALVLDKEHVEARDAIIDEAHRQGYALRPVWRLLHTLPMYRSCPRAELATAVDLERRIINLPSGADL